MYIHYGTVAVMNESTRRPVTIIAAVAAIAVLVAGVVLSTGDDDGGPEDGAAAEVTSAEEGQSDPQQAEEDMGLARRDADDVTAIGDEDADLVLIEYSDYRCPFCGAFARDTMPELKEEYIDTGKLRFEWRDFPVFGEESMEGALAARAAGEQDLYWEYHDAMYEDAPERGHLEITDAKIEAWAEEVGVPDMEQFEQDREDPELRSAIEKDSTEARQSVGATGTPTFVLGDNRIVGAQPVEGFRQAIDDQLAALEDD